MRYFTYLREDLRRFWNAYPEDVVPFWRVMMMLFQWELHAVIIYRVNFHVSRLRNRTLRTLLGYLGYVAQKLNEALSGIRLPASIHVGPGFFIMHTGNIGFHPLTRIGANFTVAPGVSIAGRSWEQPIPAAPKIGNNVFVGSGAKIVGGVSIGDDVLIGAGAVVLSDLPDGAVAVGNPARVIRIRPQRDERG